MKTANARIVPFGAIGNEPLVNEVEPQGLPRMKTIKEMAELTGLSFPQARVDSQVKQDADLFGYGLCGGILPHRVRPPCIVYTSMPTDQLKHTATQATPTTVYYI